MKKNRIENERSLYRKEVFEHQKLKHDKVNYKKENMKPVTVSAPLILIILNIYLFYKFYI